MVSLQLCAQLTQFFRQSLVNLYLGVLCLVRDGRVWHLSAKHYRSVI